MSAPAGAKPREQARPTSPYLGLTHFTEENASLFFGRDAERTMIISNLSAVRLTLLYAPSGVGKSSLLRGGVAARLHELAERSVAERGTPRYLPVVFSSWADDPVAGVVNAIEAASRPFLGDGPESLAEGLEAEILRVTESREAALLIVLDQFEEYFLYHARDTVFADELARCVNRADMRANFLISIREDAYAGLGERFEGRISNVYANHLHLDYLTRSAAREAILGPIEFLNGLKGDEEAITIEPALVEAVLDQIRLKPEERLDGANADGARKAEDRDAVEATYLQLVMKRLWDEEAASGSRRLRLATLERLGGADKIIETHLDKAMSELPEAEQETAAEFLQFLVTSAGTKIALTPADLAKFAELPERRITPVLRRLAAGHLHILRPVAAPGSADGARYEIFHDALARPIIRWQETHAAALKAREAQARLDEERLAKEEAQREALAAQENEARERRRARIFRAVMFGCIAALVLAAGAFAWALIERGRVDSQAKRAGSIAAAGQAAEAVGDPTLGPAVAALAGAEAVRLKPTFEAASQVLGRLQDNAGLPAILVGHQRSVNAVAFRPGAPGTLVSGSSDGALRVWLRGRELGRPLYTSTNAVVNDVAFSPDGRLAAAARSDGSVDLWDFSSSPPRLLTSFEPALGTGVNTVVFGPASGKPLLASGDDGGGIALWDLSNPRQPRKLGSAFASDAVNGLAFDRAASWLASADESGALKLWPLAAGRLGSFPVSASGDAKLWDLAYAPETRTLAAASDNGVLLRKVDHGSGKPLKLAPARTFATPDAANSVAFARNGKLVVSGGDDSAVRVWDVTTGRTLGPPRSHRGAVFGVAASPDGTQIASASRDNLAKVWPLKPNGALSRTVGSGTESVWSIALGPEARVAAASDDGGTVIWRANPTDGAPPLTTIPGPNAYAAAYNGSVLAVANGPALTLWQTGPSCRTMPRAACLLARPNLPSDAGDINVVGFAPGGRVLMSGGTDGLVRLWDVSDPRKIRSLGAAPGKGKSVEDADFSRRGGLLASADRDGKVRLWRVPDDLSRAGALGAPHVFDGAQGAAVYSVTFAPDGKVLASGGGNQSTVLWNVADPAKPTRMGKPLPQTNSILALAFSPDGTVVAAGDGDGDVVLWDVARRRAIGSSLPGAHSGTSGQAAIDTLQFDPTGTALYSAGRGQAITAWSPALWSQDPDTLVKNACRLARRNLTAEEWSVLFAGTKLAGHRHRTCPGYPLP